MKVYHGSDVRIEKIDLTKSGDFKDFGRGFYVTGIRKHAHQRAIDGMDKFEAVQCLYHSKVYAQLSNTDTKLYTHPWRKIYKLLIDEINSKRK